MRIFLAEFKKLLRCPFLLALLAVFTAFDIVILLDDLSPKYSNYAGIYPAIVGDENAESSAKEYYQNFLDGYAGIYDELDMTEIFREKMAFYYPDVKEDSAYYRWAEKNYSKLAARVKTIKNSGEADGDFYPGSAYKLHRKLCGLMSRSLLESMLFAALAVLYLMDHERLNAAEGLIYATKTGRPLQLIKLLAGSLFSLLAAATLFIIPLAVFSCTVPMKGLWGTSVSAIALTEPTSFFSYPFVTWVKMSVLGQLAASLPLCALLVMISAAVCAGAYLMIKNSYFVMLGAGVVFLGMLFIPYAAPAGILHTASLMTPAILFDSAGMWFIEFDPARGRWFEAVTVAAWCAIAGGMISAGWKSFRRRGI